MLPPAATVWLDGVTATVKSTTLKVTVVVCTSDPFVPVIVSVELAAGVVPDVVTVSVDEPVLPVILVGLNTAVAPAGKPETVNPTFPASPFTAVLLIVYVVLPPITTCCVAGFPVSVKFLTASVTVVLFVADPLVPVTVNVAFPPGVAEVVVTVMVVVPAPPVIVAGLNDAVAPAGKPLAEGVTVPVNPFTAATVTVYVVLPPAVTVWLDGLAVIVKFRTPNVAVAVFALAPLVPVTVSVEFAPGVADVVVTVMVEVPAPVMVAGLNDAVAPVGKPATVGVTVPLNPFTAVVVTV